MAQHDPLKVPCVPCTSEEVHKHLEAFIDAFILPRKKREWQALLLEAKEDQLIHAMRMGFPLDDRYCRCLSNKERFNQSIEALVGEESGIYFSPDKSEPMRVVPGDALDKAWHDVADGLLSIRAGRLVLVFTHEQEVWLCQR